MGCHTWFYKKNNDITYEMCKEHLIKRYNRDITFYDDLINKLTNDNLSDDDKDFIKHYPEFDYNYCVIHKAITQRSLQIIEKGLCKKAVCNTYNSNFGLTYYIENKGFYTSYDSLPHDMFRLGGYPEDNLFSYEETIKFIEEHKDEIYYYHQNKVTGETFEEALQRFWLENPDGMIQFG